MSTISFDRLKERAKAILGGQVAAELQDGVGHGPHFTEASMAALIAMSRDAFWQERVALREFAQAFEPAARVPWDLNGRDGVGAAAKHYADQANAAGDKTLYMIALRAREEGFKVIDNWDVRAAGRLIDMFPDAVPRAMRNKAIQAYQDDTEEAPWVLEFTSESRVATRVPLREVEAMALWQALGDRPVDDDGRLEEPFLQFPIGTDREEIWHWFEQSCPGFSVAEAMGFGDRESTERG